MTRTQDKKVYRFRRKSSVSSKGTFNLSLPLPLGRVECSSIERGHAGLFALPQKQPLKAESDGTEVSLPTATLESLVIALMDGHFRSTLGSDARLEF